MTLLDLMENSAAYTKSGGRYVGPCPKCGGSPDTTRFVTKIGSETGKCFSCGWSTDTVWYLREINGYSCPDAHRKLGKECTSTSCQARGKCSLGKGIAPRQTSDLDTPHAARGAQSQRQAASAQCPERIWQEKAAALVQHAHQALLADEKMLAYLSGRGLPLGCVEKNCLGYLPADVYRARASWGLPVELKDDGNPKKLFIPAGIVIPWFVNGEIHRIRVRKDKVRNEKDARYYWVPGSGNDIICLNPTASAHVVVESDLDGLLIDWAAGDLVGTIPLGTCSSDPKETALAALEKSLRILIALDFDAPRVQEKTGETIIPGGKSSLKWLQRFPRTARRWPVPFGKDPGEAYQAGVDIRAWIISGLPPAMKVITRKAETMNDPKRFDLIKAQQEIADAYSLIMSKCPTGALDWIADNRPDILDHLKQAEKAVDFAFKTEDSVQLTKNLAGWHRFHLRAFDIFEGRPPVIEV